MEVWWSTIREQGEMARTKPDSSSTYQVVLHSPRSTTVDKIKPGNHCALIFGYPSVGSPYTRMIPGVACIGTTANPGRANRAPRSTLGKRRVRDEKETYQEGVATLSWYHPHSSVVECRPNIVRRVVVQPVRRREIYRTASSDIDPAKCL